MAANRIIALVEDRTRIDDGLRGSKNIGSSPFGATGFAQVRIDSPELGTVIF